MALHAELRTVMASRWRATQAGPLFETSEPPPEFIQTLPRDYLAVITEFGGREGFLGETYLRLYQLNELLALNLAYDVPALLPEVIVFGSDGGGNAFAFPVGEPAVLMIPFVPLMADAAEHQAASFTEFIVSSAAAEESPECDPETVGMEIHDKHPICLGGSPTDPTNKVAVRAAKHAEICRFWNKVYRDALDREQGDAGPAE